MLKIYFLAYRSATDPFISVFEHLQDAEAHSEDVAIILAVNEEAARSKYERMARRHLIHQ